MADFRGAISALSKADSIQVAAAGLLSAGLPQTLLLLARCHQQIGDDAAARTVAQRAFDTLVAKLEPDEAAVHDASSLLGSLGVTTSTHWLLPVLQ